MVTSPAIDAPTRNASLEQQSSSHLSRALQATSADTGAVNAAFMAAYCALLASLSPDEVRAIADHPDPHAARVGAKRLSLAVDDQVSAEEGAATYYSPEPQTDVTLRRQIALARRARVAAGWSA